MKNKFISALFAGILSLSAVACGSASKTPTADTTAAADTEAKEEASVSDSASTAELSLDTADSSSDTTFPITITHGLGETVIEEKPENVVAIAWGNPDVPLALGIVPVGISEANFGPRDENGLLAWTAKAFEDLGATPNVFDDTDGLDYEAISDCQPDVILAAYSGLSQEEYDRLSEIAPVVAYPTIAWTTTWQEETINDATALGLEEEGKALVADVEQLIADKLSNYPNLSGKRVAFFWLSEDDLGTFYIYTNNDPRAAFLGDLGFVTPDSVTSLIDDPTAFSITVSAENADVLSDIDIIITYGTESLVTAMQNDGRFSNIPAVNNGAFVLLDSNDALAAASTPTVLSIPYAIDDYLEVLNEAANKIQ
ncbi:MAG: iron-siderophore ABC transporter substrate-binding protein [Butyrivibrio sp.]|uniref:iron-siderophore ABC transporter substrate-binding protein n=1 Tax=Butyrivibrio sp. TaxID=28121 RepID=UPI001B22C038|nr:iron-siderophore ABC transporter substrate-binding protein [Butyrivibrio sp.]MBO6242930.1 iron-siderophore ABC transporter substrate-binding protein [Butyrivibrio sp.]